MDIQYFIDKEYILDTVNKLFLYTDARNWNGLLEEVLAENVLFDMSSLGAGDPATLKAIQITTAWEQGLKPLEAIHHQTGNFELTLSKGEADVFCYGMATHYKKHPSGNNTRMFVGSYNLHLVQQPEGWRIDQFRFNCKFVDGNLKLTD